jgi:hypothetical protein
LTGGGRFAFGGFRPKKNPRRAFPKKRGERRIIPNASTFQRRAFQTSFHFPKIFLADLTVIFKLPCIAQLP